MAMRMTAARDVSASRMRKPAMKGEKANIEVECLQSRAACQVRLRPFSTGSIGSGRGTAQP